MKLLYRWPALLCSAFLALLSLTPASAQPFIATLSPEAGVYQYQTAPIATSSTDAIAQLNAQGQAGYAFLGNQIFSGNVGVSIFQRNATRPKTYTYESFVPATSASALVTELNNAGALGFRYLGDYIFGVTQVSFRVKDNSGATYAYKQLTPATDATAFLAQVNAEGANGYAFTGSVGFQSAAGFVFSSLFVKNNAANTTYQYLTQAPAASSAAFLSQANAQGLQGFRFIGSNVFPNTGTTISIYIKDTARGDNYFFEVLNTTTTPVAFVSQADAQGQRRFTYAGDQVFNGGAEVVATYVSVRPLFASNFE